MENTSILLVDWDEVRREYEKGEHSVEEICARHCISARSLYQRKRLKNWPSRHATAPKAYGAGGITVNAAERLRALVMQKLEALDISPETDGEKTDEKKEMDVGKPLRAVLAAASTIQKALDIEQKEKLRDDGEQAGRVIIDDAARDALARRLEALADSWLEAGGPPDS